MGRRELKLTLCSGCPSVSIYSSHSNADILFDHASLTAVVRTAGSSVVRACCSSQFQCCTWVAAASSGWPVGSRSALKFACHGHRSLSRHCREYAGAILSCDGPGSHSFPCPLGNACSALLTFEPRSTSFVHIIVTMQTGRLQPPARGQTAWLGWAWRLSRWL